MMQTRFSTPSACLLRAATAGPPGVSCVQLTNSGRSTHENRASPVGLSDACFCADGLLCLPSALSIRWQCDSGCDARLLHERERSFERMDREFILPSPIPTQYLKGHVSVAFARPAANPVHPKGQRWVI